MDRLLEVQQQLTRLAAGLAEHSQLANSSLPPAAAMTPILIHIEQLLDEIRASTRAVVAKASKSRQPEPRPAKRLKTADFRVNLESEDVVDYESETETEDEAVVDQVVDADELKQGKSGCNVDETEEFTGSNTKEDRSEQNDDQAHQKVQQQRLDPAAAEELEKQLKKQLRGFAKKNPERVPATLLEASTVLRNLIQSNNRRKQAVAAFSERNAS
ncbi:uncharacterized protein IUM83_19078 [Phytophthora cinnamomi]|uniref:uncharacterized protein n=1 Tax=Phytophthora cinnamomi TaxID=4785 RepID=UPI00355A8CC5|nr:hypothetical protein IUM83_19078 [Phytophthora cinnamomi]